MGAAKYNQKIITKSKIQRAQEYIKSMSSKFSSSSQTKEMPENIQMGQNDDEGSRCSSISASVKINFSKNVNDEERSSVSANVQINGSNTKNMNMNFILRDENLSEVEEEEENVTGKSAPAPDNNCNDSNVNNERDMEQPSTSGMQRPKKTRKNHILKRKFKRICNNSIQENLRNSQKIIQDARFCLPCERFSSFQRF